MSELKPCPFCGGLVRVQLMDDEGNWHDEFYLTDPWSGVSYGIVHDESMASDDCPIATYEGECQGIYFYNTAEEAVEAWNRRGEEKWRF